MPVYLLLSARVYAAMLYLYPSELRHDFGGEMAEVFAEDLASALTFHGIRGVLAVWWCALKEFVVVAVPEQAGNRIVAVPFILFCLNEILLLLELFFAFGMRLAPVRFSFAIFWPGVLAALTSVAVVIVGKTSPFCLLSLGPGSCSKFTI
jgi:hypothetical protein